MNTKNSILLMIKQNPGIDYNSLLNKFSANYSNVNSARAALSRALKDLSIFGMIRKQENNFFVTDKAELMVSSEMKNKLVLKLNTAIRSKKPEAEINEIVQTLSTLIERAKHDAGLLKAAKTSADFSISELKEIEKKVQSRISQLNYLQGILQSQIQSISEMDFNDTKKTDFSNAKTLMQKILESQGLKEFFVETANELTAKKLEETVGQKFKKNSLTVPSNCLEKVFQSIETLGAAEKNEIVFFAAPVKISFKENDAYFFGPFSVINSL